MMLLCACSLAFLLALSSTNLLEARAVAAVITQKKKAIKAFWKIERQSLEEAGALAGKTSVEHEDSISEDQDTERIKRDLESRDSEIYEALDDSRAQTRLVQLKPSSCRDTAIDCKLVTIDIGDNSPYTAVSYRWGSTSRPQTITLNGQRYPITQNLYDALIELRSRKIELIWVDALSINQQDKAEIGRNFYKMPDIYSGAESVFAWLGQSDSSFVQLKSIFEQLSKYRKRNDFHTQLHKDEVALNELLNMWLEKPLDAETANDAKQEQNDSSFLELARKMFSNPKETRNTLLKKQLEFLKALADVLSNRFWRRAWILEELTVASRIVLHCGGDSLDFDVLSSCIVELKRLANDSIFEGFSENHQHVFNIIALRAKWEPGEAISFLIALQRSFGTIALQEHDKIYSLFGISHDRNKYITDVSTKLPFDEIIRRMTETSIKSRKRLGILCLQSRENVRRNVLPSWAPDLPSIGGDRYNDRLVQYLTRQEDEPGHPRRHRWHATGDSKWKTCDFPDEGRILKVQGYQIGVIHCLSGAIDGDSLAEPITYDTVPKNSKSILGKATDVLPGSVESLRTDDIFKALTIYKKQDEVNDQTSSFKSLWDLETMKYLNDQHRSCHEWLTRHRDFEIQGQTLESWSQGNKFRKGTSKIQRKIHNLTSPNPQTTTDEDSPPGPDAVIPNLTDAVIQVLKDGRRLMSGDFRYPDLAKSHSKKSSSASLARRGITGWAHPDARLSDQVFLLKGCSFPVILRMAEERSPYGPTFRVVGDAHVVDVMNGEVWKDRDECLTDIYLI